jgi:signal peptidase
MTASTVHRGAARVTTGLLVAIALAVAALFLVPKALGYDTYVITTGSMAGTVDPGALVVSERVPVDRLAVGDVITYAPPATTGIDHLVTHRIAEITTDEVGALTFRTKGDANAAVDPWTFTLRSDVQPRLRWSVPQLGQPVLWLADPDVRRLAIGLPALVIALLAAKDLWAAIRPRRRELAQPTVRPAGTGTVLPPVHQVIDLTGSVPAQPAAAQPAAAQPAAAPLSSV